MAHIDIFNNCCLYREFLNLDTLLIMIYNETGNFYDITLDSKIWSTICCSFTLDELELIFQACIDKKPGYVLDIIENGNDLVLQFKCQELIKKYEWRIMLIEKSVSNLQKISTLFNDARRSLDYCLVENQATNTNINKIQNLPPGIYNEMEILNLLSKLESNIKQLFLSRKKELSLIPYIAKIYQNKCDVINNDSVIKNKVDHSENYEDLFKKRVFKKGGRFIQHNTTSGNYYPNNNYDKLTEEGYIDKTVIKDNDVIIGMVNQKSTIIEDEKPYKDSSTIYKSLDPISIDKVIAPLNNDSYPIKLRIRSERIPNVGDMFSTHL